MSKEGSSGWVNGASFAGMTNEGLWRRKAEQRRPPARAGGLHQARLVGEDHYLDSVAQVELGQNPRDVRLHRRLRDDGEDARLSGSVQARPARPSPGSDPRLRDGPGVSRLPERADGAAPPSGATDPHSSSLRMRRHSPTRTTPLSTSRTTAPRS